MTAKETTITLKCDALGISKAFAFEHAERLLSMRDNGGWYLADDNFEIAEDGKIRHKKNTRGTAKAK